jgi:CDP-diacylglycerol--glycerol-3-phosphate 3-phosphatidyltransferase
MHIPNILTSFRIILIPVFVIFYFALESSDPTHSNIYAWAVFTLACVTDLIDGFLARRLNENTRFGAFLDPVADKLIVCTALVLIVQHFGEHRELIPYPALITIPAVIVICREIIISALREWMAEMAKRDTVGVKWIGKWKTTFQMFAIAGLIWRQAEWMVYASAALFYVAVVLTIFSMIQYIHMAWNDLTRDI